MRALLARHLHSDRLRVDSGEASACRLRALVVFVDTLTGRVNERDEARPVAAYNKIK